MDDTEFLRLPGDYNGSNDATLMVVLPTNSVCHVADRINIYRLLDKCPLLYHAFEYGYQCHLQASIEAPSRLAVISLLRYCYTGNYLPDGFEDGHISLLLHAETYKMAEDFDVPELQLLAHGNFSCQVNIACSLPAPPSDLFDTIRFLYRHFSSTQSRQQQDLATTLLNYCISIFEYHRLGENPDFINLAREIPQFRQDLCRTNMARNFEDDCAFDIVRLALDTLEPGPSVRPTTLASRDLPEEMLVDRPETPPPASMSESMATLGRAIEDELERKYQRTSKIVAVKHRHVGFDFSTLARKLEDLYPLVPPGFEDDTAFTNVSLGEPSTPARCSTLVHRPKDTQAVVSTGFETEDSSEDEGFSMVHHPKREESSVHDDLMASPEVVPSKLIDILALTGSDYGTDDDWTTL